VRILHGGWLTKPLPPCTSRFTPVGFITGTHKCFHDTLMFYGIRFRIWISPPTADVTGDDNTRGSVCTVYRCTRVRYGVWTVVRAALLFESRAWRVSEFYCETFCKTNLRNRTFVIAKLWNCWTDADEVFARGLLIPTIWSSSDRQKRERGGFATNPWQTTAAANVSENKQRIF